MTTAIDQVDLTTSDDLEFLDIATEELTDEIQVLSPSEWAESNRYLPPSVTPVPGYYSYDLMPYLREIVDCFDVRSPIREVNLMKGAQVGWTTGVLENVIGYSIAVVKSSPMMFLTADAELAKLRMDSYVTPMIQQSGLDKLLQSNDELSGKKQAKTDKKMEWVGGGSLLPFGAKNAVKLRSFSIKFLLEDEIDGFPEKVGNDGDPCKLAEARCKAYWQVRKILRGSTPLVKSTSRMHRHFNDGDKRRYHVHCQGCGYHHPLRFSGNNDRGEYGLTYDLDGDGNLIRSSVRYTCPECGHKHREADKYKMFADGSWVATAKSKSPEVRSYHLSGLYSPASMFQWSDCVQAYLDAWDPLDNRVRDMGLLQEFYNNVLGEAFEIRSNMLKFETVSAHRRNEYGLGRVPNTFARQYCGGPIALITCAVDVHKTHLDVATFGWCQGKRAFVIEEFTFEGECESLDAEPWEKLRDLIENKVYEDDCGRKYRIQTTFVDSSWNTDTVVQFCGEYEVGVSPVMGKPIHGGARSIKEFQSFTTALGTIGYTVFVDHFKNRWSAALRRDWDGVGLQPLGHFNAPYDLSDKRLKELTVETKREKINKESGKREGWLWHRPSGSRNELWDLLMYNSAALELIAYDLFINEMEREAVDWREFWEIAETHTLYFEDPQPSVGHA